MTFLGGDDFDRAIINYWAEKLNISVDRLKKETNLNQELRLQAEEAKKVLSSKSEFTSEISGKTVSLTKDKFEDLISPFIEKTLKSCAQALHDSGLKGSEIDKIILVGGFTQSTAYQTKAGDLFWLSAG